MTTSPHAWQAHFFPSKPHLSATNSRLAALLLHSSVASRLRPTAALRIRIDTAQAIRRAWRLRFPHLGTQREKRRWSGAPLEERAP